MGKKYNPVYVFASLFWVSYVYASDLTPINTWVDIKPFKGRVVVFQAKSPYYVDSPQGKREGRNYAKIASIASTWCSGEKGYSIARFKKKSEVPGTCALINSHLKDANMEMGLPSSEELHTIAKELQDKRKEFEYSFEIDQDIELVKEQLKNLQNMKGQ